MPPAAAKKNFRSIKSRSPGFGEVSSAFWRVTTLLITSAASDWFIDCMPW